MKVFRYRKPSVKRIVGYTGAKRKVKRSLGISQAQAWTKPSRIKQKLRYEAGLYSPTVRVVRNTSKGNFPTLFGLFRKK